MEKVLLGSKQVTNNVLQDIGIIDGTSETFREDASKGIGIYLARCAIVLLQLVPKA